MEPSERVNLPAWKGQPGHYEIWFVVAMDLDGRRATWVRYDTFAPNNGGQPVAAVWAADFDAERTPPTIWGKTSHPISAYRAAEDRFEVTIGTATIRQGHCDGAVDGAHRLAWSLDYVVGSAPVRRTPAVLETVKLATQAVHATADAPVTGWIEVDGARRELVRGKAVQMHLHGTRRVDELYWIWSPALADEQATLEVISARSRRRFAPVAAPRMTSLWLRHGDEIDDLTQLPDALRPRVDRPGPGLLDVAWTGTRRATRIRAFAPPATFAGWAYRNPNGRDLHVAQSDLASCVVETFHRKHPLARWHPVARLVSDRRTALELHGPEPVAGIAYVGWDESTPAPVPAAPAVATPAAPGGTWQELPPLRAIHAAGMTYRAHAKELGADADEKAPPAMFAKAAQSWLPAGTHVATPSTPAMLAAIDAVEPGLGTQLEARAPFLPALLDYEVELGIVVLAPATRAQLLAGTLPKLGWLVANDLTARVVQILGEGQPDAMPYWAAAKSFAGFLPVTPRCWVPDKLEDRPPAVELATRVNGVARQASAASDLIYRPSQLLAAAAALAGRDLDAGDVVITGTPAGVALRVPRWKRKLGEVMLDRFGKLDAAIDMYAHGAGFLRPGDVVEVSAGFLGARTVLIDL
jgi:2-keto-4-pentenoate hydratase/2-oxohepta-3-ene-1,7-dioic acid hydratase in catechol pathway